LGKHRVRVKWCSLWPRKKGCAEKCVDYGSSSSHDRTVRAHGSKSRLG
jgi:hypothetical protein